MVMLREQVPTIQEFREFIELPENSDALFELIEGEIVKVSPGRTKNSSFGHALAFELRLFCKEHHLPCYTSGSDRAYDIQGNVVAPDFAYKPTPMSDDYPDPTPPLWVVEVVSPTDTGSDVRRKRQIYLNTGILYWEMYPQFESIDMYVPGQARRTVDIEGTLDGGDVLPGFTLAVKELLCEK